MKIYVDTSTLFKAYVNESDSGAVIAWMAADEEHCISPLSVVEMHCAVARRVRTGSITARRGAAALADFEAERRADRYREFEWSRAVFASATRLLDAVAPGSLRALDALHLAVARHFRCRGFATADRAQGEAARRLGLTVHAFYE